MTSLLRYVGRAARFLCFLAPNPMCVSFRVRTEATPPSLLSPLLVMLIRMMMTKPETKKVMIALTTALALMRVGCAVTPRGFPPEPRGGHSPVDPATARIRDGPLTSRGGALQLATPTVDFTNNCVTMESGRPSTGTIFRHIVPRFGGTTPSRVIVAAMKRAVKTANNIIDAHNNALYARALPRHLVATVDTPSPNPSVSPAARQA